MREKFPAAGRRTGTFQRHFCPGLLLLDAGEVIRVKSRSHRLTPPLHLHRPHHPQAWMMLLCEDVGGDNLSIISCFKNRPNAAIFTSIYMDKMWVIKTSQRVNVKYSNILNRVTETIARAFQEKRGREKKDGRTLGTPSSCVKNTCGNPAHVPDPP